MKIIGYLPKQPKWKMKLIGNRFHTGWYEIPYWENQAKEPITECEVPIIEGTLTLNNWGRGRSSVTFSFVDENGHYYEAATAAAFQMFKRSIKGSVTGKFTFAKQGTQISIIPYEEKPSKD